MDINDSVIAIHESNMSDDEKVALYSLLTELQINRDNPLLLMQPCWKYVKRNNMQIQCMHVKSECHEVDNAINFNELALEWFDILQSALTGMYILQIKYGVDLTKLIQLGIDKNSNRPGGSYYDRE